MMCAVPNPHWVRVGTAPHARAGTAAHCESLRPVSGTYLGWMAMIL